MNHNNSQEFIFGLDIGTRTVIGVVGYQKGNKFSVVAVEQQEHRSRAMIDGQIHDVMKVVEVVQSVKKNLEKKVGFTLQKVGIAAAGRVLRTVEVHAEQFLEKDTIIEASHIHSLELQGIRTAYERLQTQLQSTHPDYFCVGYSVTRYYLNQYMMANLEGHKGNHISMDLIATFLPQIVIDSLYTVVKKAGLEVMYLTLEPIAAIEVVIPKEIQLLNLALVDIGAGTSDIAITKEGSIAAYGMIPVAGDEITEQILHQYLTDFETAENMKLDIESKAQISFKDILSMSHTIAKETLLETIRSTVDKIALEIANKILDLNGGKVPNAVFCVGGGSQVTGLIDGIAKHLGLPLERVVIRGLEVAAKRIEFSSLAAGPEMITPLGICMTSIIQRGNSFIEIIFNGESLSLFNTHSLAVIDAATYKGFDHTNLIGRKGRDLEFDVNGQKRKIKGEAGRAAEIFLNGQAVSLHHPIDQGDILVIKPARHGRDANMSIKDIIDIEVLNSGKTIISKINDREVPLETKIQFGDEIFLTFAEEGKQFLDKEEGESGFYIRVNGNPLYLPEKSTGYLFVDIFNYIDIDLTRPQGRIILLLNGKQAAFTDPIHFGDEIKIDWESSETERNE
ncbi:MAG: cell division protein FtsA [Epulopiscium sp.]|nr:cell division protein FtsA [Candidatus Epulonipiscium sp.]